MSDAKADGAGAPLELMYKILAAVSEERMPDALRLSTQILSYEPDNSMVLEYQSVLKQAVAAATSESDDDDDEDDDDDDDSDDAKEEEDAPRTEAEVLDEL